MPLYEYECTACGHRFELIRKFSDPPGATCPSCGGEAQKLVSSPAIQFKGSGWYITDYARKGGGDKDKSADKASSGEASAKSGGSDSSTSSSSSDSTKSTTSSGSSTSPSSTGGSKAS